MGVSRTCSAIAIVGATRCTFLHQNSKALPMREQAITLVAAELARNHRNRLVGHSLTRSRPRSMMTSSTPKWPFPPVWNFPAPPTETHPTRTLMLLDKHQRSTQRQQMPGVANKRVLRDDTNGKRDRKYDPTENVRSQACRLPRQSRLKNTDRTTQKHGPCQTQYRILNKYCNRAALSSCPYSRSRQHRSTTAGICATAAGWRVLDSIGTARTGCRGHRSPSAGRTEPTATRSSTLS